MQVFFDVMGKIFAFFQLPIHIYGHDFTFWNVLMFVLVIGVILKFFGSLFNN